MITVLFMNAFFRDCKTLFADRITALSFFATVVFILITLLFILVTFTKLPPFVPIFNQLPWGEDRIGAKIQMFLPIAITTMIFIINFFLSCLIYKKMPLVARLLCISGLLASFFVLIFSIRTILLVI